MLTVQRKAGNLQPRGRRDMKIELVTLSFICCSVQKYSQSKDIEEHSYHNIQGNKQQTPHQHVVTHTEGYIIAKT